MGRPGQKFLQKEDRQDKRKVVGGRRWEQRTQYDQSKESRRGSGKLERKRETGKHLRSRRTECWGTSEGEKQWVVDDGGKNQQPQAQLTGELHKSQTQRPRPHTDDPAELSQKNQR